MKSNRFFGRTAFCIAVLLSAIGLHAAEPTPALKIADLNQMGRDVKPLERAYGLGYEFNGKKDSTITYRESPQWFEKYKASKDAAIGFYIRFDKVAKPAKTASESNFGMFDCVLTEDRKIAFTYFTRPTDLMGPGNCLVTRDKFELGKLYHVEFAFSENRKSVFLYIDGKVQFENDDPQMPAFYPLPLKISTNFVGEFGAFVFYDMPLHTDYLRIAKISDNDKLALQKKLQETATKAQNPHFKNYLTDLNRLFTQISKQGVITHHEWTSLKQKVDNAAEIAEKLPQANGVKDGIVTAFTVKPLSQEPYLPYLLPENAPLSGKLTIFAAKGEYEPASFVVFPFAPIKKFELKLSDLKTKDGKTLPASAIDATLIKRAYRSGGAWLTYHGDRRARLLTPDMLLHDDSLVKVDELRQTNSIRIDYPDGSVYQDVSRHVTFLEHYPIELPFKDAKTLQPMELPEAGRNQQFMLTFHIPEQQAEGVYTGNVTLLADGKTAGTMEITLRVLPFELPEARTYYNPDRIFYGYFSFKVFRGEPSPMGIFERYRDMKAHNMLYPAGWPDPIKDYNKFKLHVELYKKAGLPQTAFFAGSSGDREWSSIPQSKRTVEVYNEHMKKWRDNQDKFLAAFEKEFGTRNVYMYAFDEAGSYKTLKYDETPSWVELQKVGGKVLATGREPNTRITTDVQDLQVHSYVIPEEADVWHAVGARIFNYAEPFPGSENPLYYRSKIGHNIYFSNYDGTMIHGYCVITRFNGFAQNWDGHYRRFSMVYPQKDGVIDTLSIEGLREGFDDIRYFSLLQLLARKALEKSKEVELVREAKRALTWLAWLARENPHAGDFDTQRLQTIERILNLQNLMKKYGVK